MNPFKRISGALQEEHNALYPYLRSMSCGKLQQQFYQGPIPREVTEHVERCPLCKHPRLYKLGRQIARRWQMMRTRIRM